MAEFKVDTSNGGQGESNSENLDLFGLPTVALGIIRMSIGLILKWLQDPLWILP